MRVWARAAGLAAATALAGCGGGEAKKDDVRITQLAREVADLSAKVKAQDQRIADLGTGGAATALAASTQTGPANTVVGECPPGAFLFRVPTTAPRGGEQLCRPLSGRPAAPASSPP